MKSLFQYLHQPDGSITLDGLPHIRLVTVEEQGHVRGRNWQSELNLPVYAEQWEEWAEVRGTSLRAVRFIAMDQSESRLPGHPRLKPQSIVLPEKGVPLELAHTGFVVGFVYRFIQAFDDVRALIPELFGIEIPEPPSGDYIIGEAQLYDSQLADAAWRGLQLGIFSHVCPMVFVSEQQQQRLVQVSLACGDYPGCPGARILTTWE